MSKVQYIDNTLENIKTPSYYDIQKGYHNGFEPYGLSSHIGGAIWPGASKGTFLLTMGIQNMINFESNLYHSRFTKEELKQLGQILISIAEK